jgi:hypothetical protein
LLTETSKWSQEGIIANNIVAAEEAAEAAQEASNATQTLLPKNEDQSLSADDTTTNAPSQKIPNFKEDHHWIKQKADEKHQEKKYKKENYQDRKDHDKKNHDKKDQDKKDQKDRSRGGQ